MPKVAAILPARFASTRFPGKPLHRIAGKPLIQHAWERCLKARSLDAVIVATDDMRIAECAFDFGAEVALTSKKHRSGTDRIAEVVAKMPGVTHAINVQGDEPLVDPKLLDRLARELTKSRTPMITAASPIRDPRDEADPNIVKVVLSHTSDALYFSRSLIPYPRNRPARLRVYRHIGLYGYTRKFLLEFVSWKPSLLEQTEGLEQLRALERGARIRVLLSPAVALGVDTPEDAARAGALLSKTSP